MDRTGPKGPAWEVDDHGAIFASWGTLSDYSDNQKTGPFGCPLGLVGSENGTHLSMCQDRFARDEERCRDACSVLFRVRENFFETRPRELRGRSRKRVAQPRAKTNL